MKLAPWLMLTLALAATPLAAQHDSGDAPASYGVLDGFGIGPVLGQTVSADSQNPVTPEWTGDDDDGVVGNPVWTAGSGANSLTVECTNIKAWGGDYLMMWVDENDDGHWDVSERYFYGQITADGQYTFNNIRLLTINYNRNGPSACAVRILVYRDVMAGPPHHASGWCYGEIEIEDWLIDVTPLGFVISTDNNLPKAREGDPYFAPFDAINGNPPYQWSIESGVAPPGLAISTQNNVGYITGMPSAGSGGATGQHYHFDLKVTDSHGNFARKSFSIHVLPPPRPLPFRDDFSTDKGWTLDAEWSRAPASGASFTVNGLPVSEPAIDTSPGADNMILGDSIGALYGQYNSPRWAASPEINCVGASVVLLRFKRWLSVDRWAEDKARIEVSINGAQWTTVWTHQTNTPSNTTPPLVDADWTAQELDISQWAAGERTVQVRFGIGITNGINHYAGWNIDDFEVVAAPTPGAVTPTALNILTPANVSGVPACHTGSTYAFRGALNNNLTQDVLLDEAVLTLTELTKYAAHEAGALTLPMPLLLPASAAGFNFTGVFACAAVPSPGPGRYRLGLRFWGKGQSTGVPVECALNVVFELHPGPGLPGHLEVFDGLEFLINPAPVTGGRNFGARDVNLGPSPTRWITVKNTGSQPISFGGPQLSNSVDFQLDLSQWPGALMGGAQGLIGVRFSPQSVGVKHANLSFTHTAPGSSATPFIVAFMGTGVDNIPALVVREDDPQGALIVYAAPAAGGRDFGVQEINAGPTAALTVHVSNGGSQPMNMQGLPSLVGPDAVHFGIHRPAWPRRLMPGESATFTVWFDPSTIGVKSALVSIGHNALNEPNPFEFFIAGEGVLIVPVLEVREAVTYGAVIMPDALAAMTARDFGPRNIYMGPSAVLSIFLRNIGNAPLVVQQPRLTGAGLADFVLTSAPSTVAPGNWAIVMIVFHPQSTGAKSAWLEVDHNAGATFRCEVAGLGELPQPLTFATDPTLPEVVVGAGYGPVWIAAQGGTAPYSYSLDGVLPQGLVFSAAGRIIGAPKGPTGLHSFNITATDAMGESTTQTFSIEVKPVTTAINPPGMLAGDRSAAGCVAAGSTHAAALLAAALALLTLALRGALGQGRRGR